MERGAAEGHDTEIISMGLLKSAKAGEATRVVRESAETERARLKTRKPREGRVLASFAGKCTGRAPFSWEGKSLLKLQG